MSSIHWCTYLSLAGSPVKTIYLSCRIVSVFSSLRMNPLMLMSLMTFLSDFSPDLVSKSQYSNSLIFMASYSCWAFAVIFYFCCCCSWVNPSFKNSILALLKKNFSFSSTNPFTFLRSRLWIITISSGRAFSSFENFN